MKRRYLIGGLPLILPAFAQPAKPARPIEFEDFQKFVQLKLQRDYKGSLELVGEPLPGVWRLRRLVPPRSEILWNLTPTYKTGLKLQRGQDPQVFVGGYLDPCIAEPFTLEQVQSRLFPRLISIKNYQKFWSTQAPLVSKLRPELGWMMVHDLPDMTWPIDTAQLQRWELTERQVQDLALKNLTERTDIPFILAGERNGTWIINRTDGFSGERMLVGDLLQKIRERTQKPLLLTAPTHNWLILQEHRDPETPERLQQIALRLQQQETLAALPSLLFSYDQELLPYG